MGRHFLSALVFLALAVGAWAQPSSEPPPLDPGTLIGVPDPTPPTLHPRRADDAIPVAEPVQENIPVAEPVIGPAVTPAPRQGGTSTIPPLPKASTELVPQNETQVTVLGYHDFSDVNPPTEMRIRTLVFRQQMQAIKDAGIPVISMKEFLEWKNGDRRLPPFCIMITIDDGWKSVYTDAFPILKEMQFPFTLFLYTNFVTGRGSSLSVNQVKEMIRDGATIGSHSTSHYLPSIWKRTQRSGADNYQRMMEREIRDSRTWLQNNFLTDINSYCYPGGYHSPEMFTALPEFGYSLAFTVIPRKVLHDTSNWELPRYVVLGNNPPTFNRGVVHNKISAAQGQPASIDSAGMMSSSLPAPMQKVAPVANSVTTNVIPEISIELSEPQDIIANSLEMKVSGFGKVPAKLIDGTSTLLWKPSRPLRSSTVRVLVSWKKASTNTRDSAEWEFGVKPESTTTLPANIVK